MHQDKELIERFIQKYERAKSIRRRWESLFDECYEFAMPMRQTFATQSIGERRDDKIFDETAVVGVQEFASRLQAGLVPNFARWADFTAGSEIPKEAREKIDNDLEEVTDYVFEVLQNSNFGQEVHESFMDLAIGTGVLHVEEGDSVNPVNFTALPLPHVVLDVGPDDHIDHVYRERDIRYSDIKILYPDATIDDRLKGAMMANPDGRTQVLEIICKNYDVINEEAFFCIIFDMNTRCLLKYEEFKGNGSNPFICFRWSKDPGAVYGRGPLISALSAIKTTNLTIELILENAQMAISGVYQMDDDGVINPDTINLVPGTVIPKAPNSAGLQPVKAAGSFDVAQLILSDMRNNIKKALYNDMLGNPDRTPASATEIAERMADLSRRIGSAFGRLQAELVQPVLQRVVYILKKQGRIEIPTLNGRQVKVRSVSPLSQAQANQDISSVNRFLEVVQTRLGPDLVNILINSEQVATYLAKKFGVPDNLIRDLEERKQIIEFAQQLQQRQATMQQGQMQNEQAS